MRRCFVDPPPQVWSAAEALIEAVRLHILGEQSRAGAFFRTANRLKIGAWFRKVVGPYNAAIHGLRPAALDPPALPTAERKKPRMPSLATKREILARDGFHCRFCEMPVIAKETIKVIAHDYPSDAPWTDIAAEQHCFFQAANLQYDHVIPHARGGESTAENMVITCAVCNYGRMSFTLEESGLRDPRTIPTKCSTWNGLSSFAA